MPEILNCKNDQIIDLDEGIVISSRQAQLHPPKNSIDTTDAVIKTDQSFGPVSTCPEGACNNSDCPNGREIAYLSLITEVQLQYTNPTGLSLKIASALFTDNVNQPAQSPIYQVNFNDGGGAHTITVGQIYTLTVSGLPDGVYVGNVDEINSGARMQFWYVIVHGVVESWMRLRKATLEVDMDCNSYPDYSVNLGDSVQMLNGGSTNYKATSVSVEIFGQEVDATTFIDGGVTSYTAEGLLTTDLTDSGPSLNLRNEATFNLVGTIYNVGKITTQCV